MCHFNVLLKCVKDTADDSPHPGTPASETSSGMLHSDWFPSGVLCFLLISFCPLPTSGTHFACHQISPFPAFPASQWLHLQQPKEQQHSPESKLGKELGGQVDSLLELAADGLVNLWENPFISTSFNKCRNSSDWGITLHLTILQYPIWHWNCS